MSSGLSLAKNLPAHLNVEASATENVVVLTGILQEAVDSGELREQMYYRHANLWKPLCEQWADVVVTLPDTDDYAVAERAHHFAFLTGSLLVSTIGLHLGDFYENPANADKLVNTADLFFTSHPTLWGVTDAFEPELTAGDQARELLAHTIAGLTFMHIESFHSRVYDNYLEAQWEQSSRLWSEEGLA